MINFDSLLMKAFLKENENFFTNAKIQKIQQPTKKELILNIRNNSLSKKFYVNIHPSFFHLCFMNKENEQKRNMVIPKQPPMFCMLLRKYLEGARIKRVCVPDYERIFEIYFDFNNEFSKSIELCLAIELMGKYSNIILYNTDTNIILGSAHNIGEQKSRIREIAGGLPYIYPIKKSKVLLEESTETIFNQLELSEKYYYISKPLERQLQKEEYNYDQIKNLLNLIEVKYSFNKDKNEFNFTGDGEIFETANELIDEYFSFNINKRNIESIRGEIVRNINKKINKNDKTLSELSKNNYDKALKYKENGDFILTNMYRIPPNVKEFEGVKLDNEISLAKNAQKYYERYAKTKKAILETEDLRKRLQEENDGLKSLIFIAEENDEYEYLQDILKEFQEFQISGKLKKRDNIKLETIKISGATIYVGKNDKQNEYILSKIAKPEDYWFHAQDIPSSHIIVKVNGELKDEIILKAAELTKRNSKAALGSKVSIVYTKRKFVKKNSNVKAGFVVYKNEKTVIL